VAVTPRTVLRIGGVDVRVDSSWFVIAALVTWSFWARFEGGRDTPVALAMAIAAAALFFGSVLAHEVAHALEARHRGIEVRSITLYLFGGATETASEARRPGDEFAVTAVGPWTSLVLGCAFGLLAYAADRADASAVGEVAALLAWVNLVLAFFNLLPGAPLDGGRILDSIVWRVTGDHERARRVATGAGRLLGFALVGLGVAEALLVSDGLLGGVWLAFIGWFLVQAATAERARATPGPAPARDAEGDPEP
jgi:Zn-dependent protease